MISCGLLGAKLGHSYSPDIHSAFADYEYKLYEVEQHDVGSFIKDGRWDGLNVTVPYKKAVLPYLDCISDTAMQSGSVNTVVRKQDGTLYGDNTDVFGFKELVRYSGADLSGKQVIVFGSGGASAAVSVALKQMHASPIIISRTGENNYGNLDKYRSSSFIVNTTPLGMYPENGYAVADISFMQNCEAVFDLIYNPARTALLLQAESLGIPAYNGLYMLVAQAAKSAELFSGNKISTQKIDETFRQLKSSKQNIVLVGMPGSGKTSISRKLSEITGREWYDSDFEIDSRIGTTPEEIIRQKGEEEFRAIECNVLADLGKQTGKIISTGGGAVLMHANYASLHQNSVIVWIKRNLSKLPVSNRPLSQTSNLESMYTYREPFYMDFADIIVENDGTVESVARKILKEMGNYR